MTFVGPAALFLQITSSPAKNPRIFWAASSCENLGTAAFQRAWWSDRMVHFPLKLPSSQKMCSTVCMKRRLGPPYWSMSWSETWSHAMEDVS